MNFRDIDKCSFVDFPGGILGGILLVLIILFIVIDFIGRLLFSFPLIWVQEVSGLVMIIYFGLVLIFSEVQNAHVRMDLIYKKSSVGIRKIIDVISILCAMIFFFPLALRLITHSFGRISSPRTLMTLNMVTWPFYLILGLCVSLFFLTLIFLIRKSGK